MKIEGCRRYDQSWTKTDAATIYWCYIVDGSVSIFKWVCFFSLECNRWSTFVSESLSHEFAILTSRIRFDNKETRYHRRENDNFAPIRELYTIARIFQTFRLNNSWWTASSISRSVYFSPIYASEAREVRSEILLSFGKRSSADPSERNLEMKIAH